MTCKQCKSFEDCKDNAFVNGAKFDPNESVEYCTGFEPITNADRIRAWNDHELAETIANCVSEIDNGDARYSDDPNDWLKWLQQPAGEEQNG